MQLFPKSPWDSHISEGCFCFTSVTLLCLREKKKRSAIEGVHAIGTPPKSWLSPFLPCWIGSLFLQRNRICQTDSLFLLPIQVIPLGWHRAWSDVVDQQVLLEATGELLQVCLQGRAVVCPILPWACWSKPSLFQPLGTWICPLFWSTAIPCYSLHNNVHHHWESFVLVIRHFEDCSNYWVEIHRELLSGWFSCRGRGLRQRPRTEQGFGYTQTLETSEVFL